MTTKTMSEDFKEIYFRKRIEPVLSMHFVPSCYQQMFCVIVLSQCEIGKNFENPGKKEKKIEFVRILPVGLRYIPIYPILYLCTFL
jgi:hypothetical protein